MTQERQATELHRLERLLDRVPDPTSLVGSYFHRYDDEDGELTWQGCVVAEPAPGVYLVELFEWIVGSSSEQRLVRLEEMTFWRFYDDASWMTNAYENGAYAHRARREEREAAQQ